MFIKKAYRKMEDKIKEIQGSFTHYNIKKYFHLALDS